MPTTRPIAPDEGRGARIVGLVILAFVALCVVVGIVRGVTGSGSSTHPPTSVPATPVRPTTTTDTTGAGHSTASAGTASSTAGATLEGAVFKPGDCLRWDQSARATARSIAVVSCTAPHLVEVTGQATPSDTSDRYPTDVEWTAIDQRSCTPQAVAYLGHPLDPYGRFVVASLRPQPEEWARGLRTIWCGLHGFDPAVTAQGYPTLTAAVAGQPQSLLFGTGACLQAQGAGGRIQQTVSCRSPHLYVVVGSVDLSSWTKGPPTADEQAILTSPGCVAATTAALHPSPGSDVRTTALLIDPASWRAGRRVAECLAATYGPAGLPVAVVGGL